MGSPEAASPCSPSDDFHQAFSNVTCLAILSTCCLETGSDLERMWKGRRQLWAVDADLWDKPKWLGVEEGKEENGYFLLLNWVSPWTRAIQGVPVQVEHHLKILNHFFLTRVPYFHSALSPPNHATNPAVLTDQHLVAGPHDNIQSYESPTPDLPGDTEQYGESLGRLFYCQCKQFTEMGYFSSQFCLTKDLFFYSLRALYHFKKSFGLSFDLVTRQDFAVSRPTRGKILHQPNSTQQA